MEHGAVGRGGGPNVSPTPVANSRYSMLHAPFRLRWSGYVAALLAVAIISLPIGLILSVAHIANISVLYLIAILVIAVRFGRGPAILASLAAVLTFNWFFVGPVHTLRVSRPEEIVDLLVLLLTAVVTGQLAARERARHYEAEARERGSELLRSIATTLSEEDRDLAHNLDAIGERLRGELQLTVARMTLAESPEESAVPGGRTHGEDDAPRHRVLPVTEQGGRARGVLVVERGQEAPPFDPQEDRLLRAVARQLGATLERLRLRREATEAETLRRTDELKTALLGAVSHDLRTPLAAIIAASGSLRQQGMPGRTRSGAISP